MSSNIKCLNCKKVLESELTIHSGRCCPYCKGVIAVYTSERLPAFAEADPEGARALAVICADRYKRKYKEGHKLSELHLDRLPALAISQPGRNDPCPCGSGKKYKKCCREM